MKRTLLSFLIILCTALAVQAQPAPVYTLKSCLEQGLLNNYSLRITRNEQQVKVLSIAVRETRFNLGAIRSTK